LYCNILKIKRVNTQNNTKIENQQNNINNIENQLNINNNINLCAFGKEDISYLTNQDYAEAYNARWNCFLVLTEKIHFDKNKPNNHNIYMSKLDSENVDIFTGNRWEQKNKDDVFTQLARDKIEIFDQQIDGITSSLNDEINDFVTNTLFFNDYKEMVDEIKTPLSSLLFNKSEIPKTTRKLVEMADKKKLLK